MNGFASVGYFLISTLISTITFVLWIRLFIRYFAIGTFHPLSQTIYKLTAAAVGPVHKNITRGLGDRSRYDIPCLTLLIFFELCKYTLISLLFLNSALSAPAILLYSIIDLVIQPCNLLFYAIIIRTFMSWFNPDWRHPMANLILLVTEPLLRTIRNKLPPMGMLDLSPFIAIIGLRAITIFAESFIGI